MITFPLITICLSSCFQFSPFVLCTFIMSPKYFNLYLRDSSKSSKSSFVLVPFLLLLLLNTDIILLWLDEQLSSWDFPSLLCWFGFTNLWLSFLPLSLFKPSRNFWVWGGCIGSNVMSLAFVSSAHFVGSLAGFGIPSAH